MEVIGGKIKLKIQDCKIECMIMWSLNTKFIILKGKCTIIVDNKCDFGSVTDFTDKISIA